MRECRSKYHACESTDSDGADNPENLTVDLEDTDEEILRRKQFIIYKLYINFINVRA